MLNHMFKNNTTFLNIWLLSELSSGLEEKKKGLHYIYGGSLLWHCFILPYAYYVKQSGTADAAIIQLHNLGCDSGNTNTTQARHSASVAPVMGNLVMLSAACTRLHPLTVQEPKRFLAKFWWIIMISA